MLFLKKFICWIRYHIYDYSNMYLDDITFEWIGISNCKRCNKKYKNTIPKMNIIIPIPKEI